MNWEDGESIIIQAGGQNLDGACFGPAPADAPTIVLLHEGLGCVALWKTFPALLAERTGCGVFAYSRAGYGQSDPVPLPRPLDYMTQEAMNVLPEVLRAIEFGRGILLGHSDGASIATIYAGNASDPRLRGIVLVAPHFFTEPEGLASIAEAKVAFDGGDLRGKLGKYHKDPDNAFRGWNDAWLDPGFEEWNIEGAIRLLRIPVLTVQGREDQYGSLAQIRSLEERINSPLDVEILDDCKHSPHIEKPQKILEVVAEFVKRLDRNEKAGVEVA